MAYLLDTNVFIEAKRRHYGLDFCPAFWDWLVRQNVAGMVFSSQRVETELLGGHVADRTGAPQSMPSWMMPIRTLSRRRWRMDTRL